MQVLYKTQLPPMQHMGPQYSPNTPCSFDPGYNPGPTALHVAVPWLAELLLPPAGAYVANNVTAHTSYHHSSHLVCQVHVPARRQHEGLWEQGGQGTIVLLLVTMQAL